MAQLADKAGQSTPPDVHIKITLNHAANLTQNPYLIFISKYKGKKTSALQLFCTLSVCCCAAVFVNWLRSHIHASHQVSTSCQLWNVWPVVCDSQENQTMQRKYQVGRLLVCSTACLLCHQKTEQSAFLGALLWFYVFFLLCKMCLVGEYMSVFVSTVEELLS